MNRIMLIFSGSDCLMIRFVFTLLHIFCNVLRAAFDYYGRRWPTKSSVVLSVAFNFEQTFERSMMF